MLNLLNSTTNLCIVHVENAHREVLHVKSIFVTNEQGGIKIITLWGNSINIKIS